MNISFKCGYYIFNKLFEVNADLNVSAEYYSALKEVLKIRKPKDYSLVRIGLSNKDGGYLMINDFEEAGVAYSFGISNDVNWDNVMAELGYNIYMYDHTIEALPYTRNEFHFSKEGISGKNEKDKPLKTLKYYMEKNGHSDSKNMILKMDVEGAEWDFLETATSKQLNQFNQIVFEFHNLVRASEDNRILDLLTKLNKTHQLVHLHANNSGYLLKIGDTTFGDVLEATYINKSKYATVEDKDLTLPSSLDAPNDSGRPDVILGKWNHPIVF